MKKKEYQPKTGAKCSCKRGVMRDNCSSCEGTGWVINFRKIRAMTNLNGYNNIVKAMGREQETK